MKTDNWLKNFVEASELITKSLASKDFLKNCRSLADVLANTYETGNNVFVCGNGGSHCDALHFAEELTGRFKKDRKPLGALALGEASHMSCVSNDFGFNQVFTRQLALAKQYDTLIVISTSGNSKNLIQAVKDHKERLFIVGLLGKGGGELKDLVDLAIVVPSDKTERIQEMHIKIIHNVIEDMERKLFPENYND